MYAKAGVLNRFDYLQLVPIAQEEYPVNRIYDPVCAIQYATTM